jgi:TLD
VLDNKVSSIKARPVRHNLSLNNRDDVIQAVSVLCLKAGLDSSRKMIHVPRQDSEDSRTPSLRELVGDFGVALFDPLIEEETLCSAQHHPLAVDIDSTDEPPAIQTISEYDDDEDEKDDDDDENDYFFHHEVIPVQIEPEEESCLRFAPRLLSKSQFQELVNEGIPRNLQMYHWKRIFAIGRDGDTFVRFIEHCRSYKHTLMVVKTTKGNILGGFASEPWRIKDGFDRCRYFGTGACFLFSDSSSSRINNHQTQKWQVRRLTTYKWTGINEYCQFCDVDRQIIAMGGGKGNFGLIIEDNFLRGATGYCSTFANPPLIPGLDGSFDILGFEVYGILPLVSPTVRNTLRTPW